MKRMLIAALVLLAPVAAMAQDGSQVQTSGSVTAGVQQVDVDGSTARFNRFRDIGNGFYLYNFDVEAIKDGRFISLGGQNITRDDQELRLGVGSFGVWRLDVERNEIPNRLSDKAKTPYFNQGNGLLTVPNLVGIQDDGNIATGTPTLVPTAGQMAVNDQLIADYIGPNGANLHSVSLGTERERNTATLSVTPLDFLKFRLSVMDERKDGNKVTYGPIGDRPPRTLNIQMTEPIDYQTRELRAEADLTFEKVQGRVAYLLSDFENEIDTLTWQNIYFTPTSADGNYTLTAPESDAAGTRRLVSSFGQRALSPDNRYHNVSATFGFDLPLASRLTASTAYGWMKQDETLLPYSFLSKVEESLANNPDQLAWNDTGRLPRAKADAEINTKLFNLDYTINPVQRLNLRAFFRYYDLDNDTAQDRWRYVAQDVVGATGGTGYRNHRINLPYAYDKTNFGLESKYTLAFWRTSLGLGYEREEIDRDFREADTDENIFRATLQTRPTDWINVRAKYVFGDRESKGYNSEVTDLSYFYTTAQSPATGDRDNPLFAFGNHPDLRKFDVSDRERNQFEVAATVTPVKALDLTASYGYRNDDFESGVKPTQPLLNFDDHDIAVDDRNRATLGIQLGLLEETRKNYALDAHYAPGERWSVSAFANREEIESDIRGMVFNENRRENPSIIASDIANLGAWDDARYLYELTTKDITNTIGAGAGVEIIRNKLKLSTDATLSRGKVEWNYRGYGTDFSATVTGNPDWETNQFGFRSPQTVRNNQYTLNASLEYQFVEGLVFGLHYLFDRYSQADWMEQAEGPWVEQVGSEFFLRDTSRDNRWGNRLVNMGTPLSGSYEAHVGYATVTYRF